MKIQSILKLMGTTKPPERPPATYGELFGGTLSKSERTRIEIAQAAIENYSTLGVEQTNFDRVAKSCGVTRPLVQHYFGTREALFAFVVKYIRSHAQNFARARMATLKRPTKGGDGGLRLFLETCLDWVRDYPTHAKVGLLLQYSASVDLEVRELNTEMSNAIHQHVSFLLMNSRQGLHTDLASTITTARMLQHFLMGALMSRFTETHPMPEAEFRKVIMRQCLELAVCTTA